jgi:hypothetical protein
MASLTLAGHSTKALRFQALRASAPFVAAVAWAALLTLLLLTQLGGSQLATQSQSGVVVQTESPNKFVQFQGRPF